MATEDAVVLPLDGAQADLAHVGGKGASLARLAAAGLPVPPGFHVTTAAYRDFVAHGGLQDEILGLVAGIETEAEEGRPDSAEAVSRRIGQLFAERDLPDSTAAAIRAAYREMGDDIAVAVRSSATAEDLPDMSFAGQQDTFLNISGVSALLDAVRRCWASLWTARAIGYRARHGIAPGDVALAVVVQQLVPADAAGILFTTNPLTGARDEVVINAGWGLGEAVVGGQVTPDTYVVGRSTWALTDRQISDKTVMTVRTPDGTRDEPVPAQRRSAAVLSVEQAADLARLGVRVEELYGRPMDVEWVVHDGDFFVVQARPITGLPSREPAREPAREEWNDSLAGDYLWTCANLGEAIPSVMTPCTWSLVQIFMSETMSVSSIGPHRICGNIGGRFYLNLSLALAIGSALGLTEFVRRSSEQAFGRIPPDVQIPPLPVPRRQILRSTLATVLPFLRRVRSYQKRLPVLLAAAPVRCERLHATIRGTGSAGELRELWHAELDPLLRDCSRMLAAGARMDGAGLVRIRPRLEKLVGEADTNALLSALGGGASLASLGPVLGLDRLARGEIDRETYVRQWGHRCPDEFEVSMPRPAEQPEWIDRQLAGIRQAEHEPVALLARQEQARAAAWERFQRRYPRRRAGMRRRLDRAATAFRAREDARSEVIRAFGVLRAFVLRAGELSGHGEDLFFLSADEILALLGGDDAAQASVGARRSAYTAYRSLPPYPTLIRGHFDPFGWAADPHRRSDIADDHHDHGPIGAVISGFPGAAGVVEGTARVLRSAEEGDQLQPGEILVTTVTNIGWTPLFPRAAAVVTDIGAPLSHAAIVARELGIPAVVGCGNATTRLRSGDRVRVDGEHGTVDILN